MRWNFNRPPRKTLKVEETTTSVKNEPSGAKKESPPILVNGHKCLEDDDPSLRNGQIDKSRPSNGHCPHTVLTLDNNGNKERDLGARLGHEGSSSPDNGNRRTGTADPVDIPTEDEADSIDLSSDNSVHNNPKEEANPPKHSSCRVSISWEKSKDPLSSVGSIGSSSSSDGDVDELGDRGDKDRLLCDKWRVLFDQFDPEGFGEIPWPDFLTALRSREFRETIEAGKLQLLAELAKSYSIHSSAITYQHFVNIMSGKRSRSFNCAVHHRDREISSENDFHLLQSPGPHGLKRMARLIADEFLTDERDRKYYADHYRCLPPPLFIISVTLIELGFFTYYTVWHGEISSSGPLPMDSPFVYRPDKRQEIWRFLVYMVLHAGWVHLMFNLLVQLLVGLPLEMVHGSVRIGCVYMAGVLAGSLGTSVFDPDVYLVGASGGVYALLAAHLANVLLNYNNMEFGIVRLLGVFLIASVDVGFAIYDRYAASPPLGDGSPPPVSYVAHLTGALAGLTIGLLVLKNFEQKLREQLMWWLALGVYGACTLFAILFNIFHPVYPEIIPSEFLELPDKFPHPNSINSPE